MASASQWYMIDRVDRRSEEHGNIDAVHDRRKVTRN